MKIKNDAKHHAKFPFSLSRFLSPPSPTKYLILCIFLSILIDCNLAFIIILCALITQYLSLSKHKGIRSFLPLSLSIAIFDSRVSTDYNKAELTFQGLRLIGSHPILGNDFCLISRSSKDIFLLLL